MDPKACAEWIIHQHDEDPDEAAFDGMDDMSILNMLYPLAKAYLAQLSKHNPIRRHGSEYTTGGNSEGV